MNMFMKLHQKPLNFVGTNVLVNSVVVELFLVETVKYISHRLQKKMQGSPEKMFLPGTEHYL